MFENRRTIFINLILILAAFACDDEASPPKRILQVWCVPGACAVGEQCLVDPLDGQPRCVTPEQRRPEAPEPDPRPAPGEPEPGPRPPEPVPEPVPRDPCADVRCPANSLCDVDFGAAVCVCYAGLIEYNGACDADDDLDGLPDTFEYQVASLVAPILQFGTIEEASGRREHWSVAPSVEGFEVFFALSYFLDDGDGILRSLWHYGDSEFVIVRLLPQGDFLAVDEVFLSAHFLAATDGSRWYSAERFEVDDSDGGWHPVVWVGEGKHANYPDESTCEEGAFFTDSCSTGTAEVVRVRQDANLGNGWAPILDEVKLAREDGALVTEWFWTPRRFCGWSQPDGARDERQCAKLANSYGRQLAMWERGDL